MPHLTDHDLRQMDEVWLQSLPELVARSVLSRVVADLKEARDRLNQNSDNSSRPPGSRLPWENRRGSETDEDEALSGRQAAASPTADAAEDTAEAEAPRVPVRVPSGRKPGQQPGAKGHGRTQKLVVHEVEHRHPAACAACGTPLTAPTVAVAYTGWDTTAILILSH